MKLATRIPPPVQALICGVLMWLVDTRVPGGEIEIPMRLPIAILFAVAGIALVANAMLTFRRAGTTVDPFNPDDASELVVEGVFRYSRNPMYVSLLLVLIGWAIWLGSPNNIVMLILFVWYITVFQIRPEEKALTSLFGEAYDEYRSKVRRWL